MGAAAAAYRTAAVIRLPEPHPVQEIFTDWHTIHTSAQVLVAPCGTKLGKTFGAALWLLDQALVNPGFFCVWIAPTTFKCRIAYRYMKAMLPEIDLIDCKDSKLEIHFGNGSVIKFLHGRDAEVTVEGEAIDAFVMDEAGKQKAQLWFSLFTTITQTEGLGIITGTPRGHNWYYDIFRKAKEGDPFFCWAQLPTEESPFVSDKAIAHAKRLLPPHLFDQYYRALFVAHSSVYGDLATIWRQELRPERKSFWLHPDPDERAKPVCIGVDLAKRRDYTVYFAINADGETVGYARMRNRPYRQQARLLGRFCEHFTGEGNEVRYDRTGVGDAVGEQISEAMDKVKGDWTVSDVVFTNAGKQELVTRAMVSIEQGWWHCPRIERVEHEFASLEVSVTKTGLHTYSAPDGDHDDVHWAACLAISGAFAGSAQDEALELIQAAMDGKLLTTLDDDDDDDESDEPDLADEIDGEEDYDFDEESN